MGDTQDRIYAVGFGGDMYGRAAEIDRFAATNGASDSTFGPDHTGVVTLGDTQASPPAFSYVLDAVALDDYGRIVIAGSKLDSTGSFAVVGRFWP
jgi:hypothetical protein